MHTPSPSTTGQVTSRKKRGFTLTEIAIVLGIIGLILGAIWVAAASVYNNLRISKTTNQLLSIAQGVRTLYATAPTTGETNSTDLTKSLIAAGIFPSDMVSGTSAFNAWNQAVTVASTQITNSGDSFVVNFAGVPTSACTVLLTSTTGAGRDSGLYYAAAASGSSAITSMPATGTTFPVAASTAATSCGGTTSTTNMVSFGFKLKG